jgi:hypothetical protein
MRRFGWMMALLLLLGACGGDELHPSDEMGSTVETPHDGEGDVDEPTIK